MPTSGALRSAAVVLLFATSFFTAPLFAADPVAAIHTSSQTVDWQPNVANDGIRITVIGPDGAVYQHEFAAGETPVFRLADIAKNAAINGAFTYELRATPRIDASVKRELAAARAADDADAIARIERANGLGEALVQSGTFSVVNGSVVARGLPEAKSAVVAPSNATASLTSGVTKGHTGGGIHPADNVIADDLIVQGSTCLGLDCVNGESFGFDTLKLKENNTRILFEDSTVTSGYATNDWELQANEDGSGGAAKFSINDVTGVKTPFTITAGAPTNSLFVASTGKVGFRTATPLLDLHIATTDTPAMRFEQTNASYTAQTWDVGGNEANFFVRDLTGGSRLTFRIRPGAPTSSIDVAASGNVGFGSASPTARLYVTDSTQNASRITLAGQEFFQPSFTSTDGIALLLGVNRTGNRQMWVTDSSMLAGPTPVLRFMPNIGDLSAISVSGGVVTPGDLRLNSGGGNIGIGKAPTQPIDHRNGAYLSTGGVWTNASSRALKQDIRDLSGDAAMCALSELQPVEYAYKLDPKEHHVGFIAEDVPDLVATKERKGLSSMDIVAVLTKVVQEQQKTIEQLQQRLDSVEKNQR
jgi:hypothetical protein